MAGDWIKFEVATSDKPEVWAIADELAIDPDAVIGKLLRVWAWFDQHTSEGNAPTVTKKLLNRTVGVTDFCEAMISVGWMLDDGKKISLPNFEDHNGKTAKTRAVTARRVAKHKKGNGNSNGESVTEVTEQALPDALPREEKRREDKNNRANAEGGAKRTKGFSPPSVDEVQAYCLERGNSLDPQEFIDHYEANGWMRGKNKIKDWKACVRTWESSRAKKKPKGERW